jgi:hypothetical protein
MFHTANRSSKPLITPAFYSKYFQRFAQVNRYVFIHLEDDRYIAPAVRRSALDLLITFFRPIFQ